MPRRAPHSPGQIPKGARKRFRRSKTHPKQSRTACQDAPHTAQGRSPEAPESGPGGRRHTPSTPRHSSKTDFGHAKPSSTQPTTRDFQCATLGRQCRALQTHTPPLMLDFLAFLGSKLREVQAHRPTLGPRVREAQANRHTGTQAQKNTGPVHSHAPAIAHVRTHMLPGTRLREAQAHASSMRAHLPMSAHTCSLAHVCKYPPVHISAIRTIPCEENH